MQILSHMSEVEAPLVYSCAALYQGTLSGESSLMPAVENQLVSSFIHVAIPSGLLHQGDREQKVWKQKFRLTFGSSATSIIYICRPL